VARFLYDPTTVYAFVGLSLVLTFLLVYRMTRRGSGKRPSDLPPQKLPPSPPPGRSTPVPLPARINEAVETMPNELPKSLQDEMDRVRADTALTFVFVLKSVLTNFEEADRQIQNTFQKKFRESEEAKRKEFTLNEEEVAALKKLLDKVKDTGAGVTPASPAPAVATSTSSAPPPSKPLVKLEGID
jgi:hypothetical protein